MLTKDRTAEFLKHPLVDKFLGLFVVLPSAFVLYLFFVHLQRGEFDWFRLCIAANMVVIIVTTLVRRQAVKVSTSYFFWIVTFLRTFWLFLILTFVYVSGQTMLAPAWVSNSLLVLATAIIIYSRLSLGRNIGFIPAKRKLVTTGAYGLARHPIHTAELVFLLSYILASFTPLNFFLLMLGVVFIIGKSLVEESFFKDDEEYQEYRTKVPYLWVPGVI